MANEKCPFSITEYGHELPCKKEKGHLGKHTFFTEPQIIPEKDNSLIPKLLNSENFSKVYCGAQPLFLYVEHKDETMQEIIRRYNTFLSIEKELVSIKKNIETQMSSNSQEMEKIGNNIMKMNHQLLTMNEQSIAYGETKSIIESITKTYYEYVRENNMLTLIITEIGH